jgi:hypothetical protein
VGQFVLEDPIELTQDDDLGPQFETETPPECDVLSEMRCEKAGIGSCRHDRTSGHSSAA